MTNTEFPVVLDNQEDPLLTWAYQPRNFPGQYTELEFDLAKVMFRGMQQAREHFGLSPEALLRRVNTYVYIWAPRMRPADGDVGSVLRAEMESLRIKWDEQYLPEILGYIDEFEDLLMLSIFELRAYLEKALARFVRMFEVHFLLLTPAREAITLFAETYRGLLGGEELDAYRLLGGLPSKTTDCATALWRLSRLALRTPAVREILEAEPAGTAMIALDLCADAVPFRVELDAFLDVFGHRTDSVSVAKASWLEDPAPVLATVRGYLRQPDSANPALAIERAEREREAAIATARQRLSHYPRPVVREFETLLRAAQDGSVLSEENTHYINFRGVYEMRKVMLCIGNALADADIIATQDDIWSLSLSEVREALYASVQRVTQAQLCQRQEEMVRWKEIRPPAIIGGIASETTQAVTPDFIRGTPGAAGKASGIARILRSVAEAGRLQPGEVLVTEQTQPSWTPLFAVAAAVVTDTGGVLNHAAIAAREYGIPAVVSAPNATSTITDGDTVVVDGTSGTVRIEITEAD